jgi:sulfoxide reductase heme-binding subunit YedZ
MMRGRDRRMWLLGLIGILALALTVGLVALQPYGTPLDWLIRGAALLGYQAIFLAVLSSAYVRQMVRFFGRSFVKLHHALSVAGLVLITLHPVAAAVRASSPSVFLPRFDSLLVFLQLGGRLAWYLLVVASLTAALRKSIGRAWRTIHVLNYVAFLLGTVHALMIGTDFQHGVSRGVAICLALAVVGTFVHRRLARRRRRER